MDPSSFIEYIDRGTSLYWHSLARVRGHRLCRLGDELEWVASDLPGGINRVFRINLSADSIRIRIPKITRQIETGEIPPDWLITGNARPENLAQILSQNGFAVETNTGSGMAMNLAGWKAPDNLPASFQALSLDHDDRLPEWTAIINEALFECDLFTNEQMGDLFALPCTRFYLGLLDGIPVSIAMAAYAEDMAELCWLATLPPYRGRGFGGAMSAKALRDMRKSGKRIAVLRSEKDAIPLYRRLGFTEYYTRMGAHYRIE